MTARSVEHPFIRSPYNYDWKAASTQAALRCTDPSLTVQSDMVDADINVIVKRFGITGALPVNLRAPEYVDYDGVFDFASAQNALIAARDNFMQLPADVRERFDNNPQLFLQFCSDPANLPEMRNLGLAIPEKSNGQAIASKADSQTGSNEGTAGKSS